MLLKSPSSVPTHLSRLDCMETVEEESGPCEFISNVIGMVLVGINLIRISGVHPLHVILCQGWGHFYSAISGWAEEARDGSRSTISAKIIQFGNCKKTCKTNVRVRIGINSTVLLKWASKAFFKVKFETIIVSSLHALLYIVFWCLSLYMASLILSLFVLTS